MSQFSVRAKLWPSGINLDTDTDNNMVTVPPAAHFDRKAAPFASSNDGTQKYQFLFWNTGRHITNKRHVHWDFSVGGWGIWSATKWYGIPGGNGGKPHVRVDPFSISGDGPITGSGTAIANPPASTFPAGAFPFGGDDHMINTAGGPVDVAAKDPFANLQFAGWDQLIWGGDDSGEFDESDAGGSQGSPSFFPVGTGTFHVNQNNSADLLAVYGNSRTLSLGDILNNIHTLPGPISQDTSPIDLLRLVAVETLLQKTQPTAGGQNINFQTLIQAASRMNVDDLNAALKSVQTSIALGNTALSTIQAQIKAKTEK